MRNDPAETTRAVAPEPHQGQGSIKETAEPRRLRDLHQLGVVCCQIGFVNLNSCILPAPQDMREEPPEARARKRKTRPSVPSQITITRPAEMRVTNTSSPDIGCTRASCNQRGRMELQSVTFLINQRADFNQQ